MSLAFDLPIAAVAPSPPVSPLIGGVAATAAVILTMVVLAWRVGRNLATKDDLKPMLRMATKDDLATLRTETKDDLATLRTETRDDLAALRTENEKAHAMITENVMENRRQIQQLDATVRSIAADVAFIAGRMHERSAGPQPPGRSTSQID